VVWHGRYINYGQKGATMEERACEKLCQHLDLQLGRINMSSVSILFFSPLQLNKYGRFACCLIEDGWCQRLPNVLQIICVPPLGFEIW
jgi:hypothetical protein